MNGDDMRQPPNGGPRSTTLACPDNVPPELLSAWRDGLLPANQAARMERHTPWCAACAERLRDYDAASSALNTQLIPRPGADLWPGVRAAIEREIYRDAAQGRARRGPRLPRGLALGGIGAAVAALLLVALFAGLLFSHNPGHISTAGTPSTTTGPNPTTTATTAPTAPPAGIGRWTTMTGCPDFVPPSIRAIYDAGVEQQKGGPTIVTFKRSDDCGASWTQLTPPPISGVDYATNVDWMDAFANPVNPQTAYLSVLLGGSSGCSLSASTGGGSAAMSSMPCLVQFVSINSGATWSRLSLPVRGALAITSPVNTALTVEGLLRPQGQRLYGVVTDTVPGMSGVVPPGRLVVSSDGIHWAVADAGLAARGYRVWDFAVTPAGSTIYVTAQPLNDPSYQAPTYEPTLSIWSSPDGGQTWTENAHAPDGAYGQGGAVEAMAAGLNGGQPVLQPVLYIVAANKSGQTQLLASVDGGRNWTIDTRFATGNTYQLIGTVRDGSALLESSDATQPTLAWRPDTGEQEVGAGAGLQHISHVVLPSANSSGYLWLQGTVDTSVGGTTTMYTNLKR